MGLKVAKATMFCTHCAKTYPPETFNIIKYSHFEKVMWKHAVNTWLFFTTSACTRTHKHRERNCFSCESMQSRRASVDGANRRIHFILYVQTHSWTYKRFFKRNLLFIPVSISVFTHTQTQRSWWKFSKRPFRRMTMKFLATTAIVVICGRLLHCWLLLLFSLIFWGRFVLRLSFHLKVMLFVMLLNFFHAT